jgi:molecular chaperone DnaJ
VSTQQKTELQDYYGLLHVAPDATHLEIRRAFRGLARRLHPDVNPAADAAERFAAIARAYDTLSDPERRRAYDLARSRPGGSVSSAEWKGPSMAQMARHDLHGKRRVDPGVPTDPSVRGLDIWQTVHLTLREAAFGTEKSIEIPRHDVCVQCRGSGAAPGAAVRQCGRCHGTGRGAQRGTACPRCHGSGNIPTVPCPLCRGSGRIAGVDTLPLRLPPALEHGEVIRIKNQGEPGPKGGPRGDLHLKIEVLPDPVLRRRGAEVYATVDVSPDQARDGGQIDVPTLRGTAQLKLPRDTSDGATFTLKGQGLRLKGRWRRGDQHVTVHIAGVPAAASTH